MRTVFFGSSGFSVPILKSIAEHTICVVTKKARPRGRGYSLDDNEVKKTAKELDIPLLEVNSFKDDIVKTLPDYRPDLYLVASFGLIVPKWVLDIPSEGPINVHPSLLPLYRGPSPMQWTLLSGDEMTGITLIRMNEKMDEGDILYQEQVTISEGDDFIALSERLSTRVVKILPDVFDRIGIQGMLQGTPQRHELATYTPIITKEMGAIDWKKRAVEIGRQIRAFVLWPTAYTFLDGKMMKIFKAVAEESSEAMNPGRIRGVTREGMFVDTDRGVLKIQEIQMENKKRMRAYDFAQGYRGLVGKSLT